MSETEVRPLTNTDFEAFAIVVTNAYPTAHDLTAERQRLQAEWVAQSADPTVRLYGAFREGRLLGGMQLYDYTMTFSSSQVDRTVQVPVGGVGMVAVDLLHKKEHVAHDLITFFLDHYRTRGTPLGLLYPFRPDFYKQMGFGYGTKMSEYRVQPSDLPTFGSKEHLVDLGPDDNELLLDYYNRYQVRTHGMLRRTPFEIARKVSNLQNHLIGYRQDGRLHGYLQYQFRSTNEGNFLLNDIEVFECLYDAPEVLKAFLKYLHAQADQIRRIVFWTQDEDFQYLFLDPRNGSDYLMPRIYHASNVQGVGLMYRVLDTEWLLRMLDAGGHSFADQTCRLHIELTDSFLPANDGTLVVELENGRLQSIERAATALTLEPGAIAIHLDVADFSSVVVGAVGFRTLYTYGLAKLSDPAALDRVDRIFHTEARPRCVTAF